MEAEEDKMVINRAVKGDSAAFRQLLDRHYATIFRMAYRFCGNKEDAEDVTQMACMKLAQNISRFEGKSAFTTWLYTLVLNTSRDWQRSERRHERGGIAIDVVENIIPTNENAERDLANKEIFDQIRALPEGERDAIWLVFGEGLSHKEAASVLGCAEGTISYRIFEARKKLADNAGGRKHG